MIDFDLDDGIAIDTAPDGILRTMLAQLPCPTLALCREAAPAGLASLLPAFDVSLHTDAELEYALVGIQRAPLAATALCQLMRLGEVLDLHASLIAESLAYSTLQGGPEFAAWLAAREPAEPRPTDPSPAVRVERAGPRLDLTLNRPEKRNAFSSSMRDALVEGLELASADPTIREVVLRGAGSSFCSGGDLDEFGTLPDPSTAHAIRSTRSPARLMARCAERVEAVLHGACVGAGIELPAFAERVVATPDAFFELPEVAFGLVPGAGGTASLPRRIGRQRTTYLALSGRRIDARAALEWGLIDEIAELP